MSSARFAVVGTAAEARCALLHDGHSGWLSLETHWRGPSGDRLEASSICARLVREMIATAA